MSHRSINSKLAELYAGYYEGEWGPLGDQQE